MARTKKTVNGGYQILDFNNANITTDGVLVEGSYKTILESIESNKPLMVKNLILVDAGVDIEDNYASIVKVGTAFILSIGIVGDKTYTLSITDADTTSYQINDNATQSELNVVEDMVNQLSYNEAAPFDSTQTYVEGQYVIHEGKFYKCKIAVEEAGEFNINNWKLVTIGNELEKLIETNKEINQNLSNKLSIPKSWTLLGRITPDTPQQIVLSDNVNNYDWIALVVHQGYASIDLIIPSYITRWNTTNRFSFNHGKPSGGWGMSGFVDFSDTNFMLSEHSIEGWEFVALELYGIK